MSGAHLISASDRDLMKRLTIVLVFVFLFTAAFARLERTYAHKFASTTGHAHWIWARHRMSDNHPLVFFAARNFDLPAKRYFTHLKIAVDPEYTLYINGQEIEGRLSGKGPRTLDFYDISKLVHTGTNRIMVAVRAPGGIGGLLASIDIAPETQNYVVTNGEWRIFREWHPDLPHRDVPNILQELAGIVGQPPIGRWNYPNIVRREAAVARPANVLQPRESFPVRALLPMIRTKQGIAVAVAEPQRAMAFDFGPTKGRVRVISERAGQTRIVRIRFASLRSELGEAEWNLRPVVLAEGERSVTIPEEHQFRYVMLFGKDVRAEVLQPLSK
jgi:hypothetical protein